jgi:hypothetical protein
VNSCGMESPTEPTRWCAQRGAYRGGLLIRDSARAAAALPLAQSDSIIQRCYANPKGMAIGLGKIKCFLLDYWYELTETRDQH